jgi:pyridoxine 5-phosphate synthase
MIELGVNIDHVATVREARKGREPDPVWAAVEAHLGGADGITVHLREDRRHIQDDDVRRLRELTHIKLNLEMAATDEMVGIACALKPEMAMLVPEGRHEITTEGGLDVAGQEARPARAWRDCATPASSPACSSTPNCRRSTPPRASAPSVCEIHTGPYAHAFFNQGATTRARPCWPSWKRCARPARRSAIAGMRFNAGHALNYFNVQPVAALPGMRELHIGHAIVSRAIFVGLREAVARDEKLMREAQCQ